MSADLLAAIVARDAHPGSQTFQDGRDRRVLLALLREARAALLYVGPWIESAWDDEHPDTTTEVHAAILAKLAALE